MKKIYALTMVALMAVATDGDAQSYRRWDFTSWSTQTVENLLAEANRERPAPGWSDIEARGNDGVGAVAPAATDDKCFWLDEAQTGNVAANGQVIAEMEGLDFNPDYCANRSLAIAVDYPSTAIGTYAGPQYLWLGGGNKAAGQRLRCFTIHNVPIGEKITFVVESHRSGQARGLALYVDDVNDDSKRIGDAFNTDEQASYTWENWMLPEGTADEDGDGMVDIMVYNTNGCHVYSIEVGENTEARTVGYLYGGDLAADLGYSLLAADYNNIVTPIAAQGEQSYEALADYDAIVISSTVTDTGALMSLRELRPTLPLLSLNPAVYELWGYGTTTTVGVPFATVTNPGHALFRNVEIVTDPDAEVTTYVLPLATGAYTGVKTLTGPFAGDMVLATAYQEGDIIAIHGHNLGHNGYLFIPYTQDVLAGAAAPALLSNGVKVLAASKAPVTAAPQPSFTLDYDDMATTVTIISTVPLPEIFYTTDGTEPTESSTRYTQPFTLTRETTVKAVVRGDGYLMSAVGEQAVDLRQMAPMPTFTAQQQDDGSTVVTISSELEGAKIYYNYKGENTPQKSSPYTGPVTLTRGRTIYAFQTCDGYLDSKVAQQRFAVRNPHVRIDILSKMDANRDEYFNHTLESSRNADQTVGYYFSWGNSNSYPYYDPEYDQVVPDQYGEDSIVHTRLNAEEVVDIENGWSVRSRGQRISWEAANPELNYGDSGSGPYNPATVEDENVDLPVTSYLVNLTDWDTSLYPASGKIQSTEAFAGPFDVVAYIVNAKGSPSPRVVIEAATDAAAGDEAWTQLGDTITLPGTRRLYSMSVRSYEEATPAFVRIRIVNNVARASVLNIYIASEGEKSKQVIDEEKTGIADAKTTYSVRPKGIYSTGGMRLQQLQKGLNIIRKSDGTTQKVYVK